MSLVMVNSENLPLRYYSCFDSPRYDCVLFVSLIKLNGESIAAKNILFMSLVMVNSENLPLKDYSSFDTQRYDCVLFCVTNQVKRRIDRCKKCTFHVTCHGKQ